MDSIRYNWDFAERLPVPLPRSAWDFGQLFSALRPAILVSGLFTTASVADLMRLCGCSQDQRLRRLFRPSAEALPPGTGGTGVRAL